MPSISTSESLLQFFHIIFELKKTRRTGWLKRGMTGMEAESIADHMYRMSMISMVLPLEEGVSRERCIMISLVHDLAEALIGDLTPECGISSEDKHKMEAEALDEITKSLASESSRLIRDLWWEYETGSTAEARLVKQIDKFEFALQAAEYEREHGLDFSDFIEKTEPMIKDPHLKSIYGLMRLERTKPTE